MKALIFVLALTFSVSVYAEKPEIKEIFGEVEESEDIPAFGGIELRVKHDYGGGTGCYAWTACGDGRLIQCQAFAPCQWRVIPYQYVQCDGRDHHGRYRSYWAWCQ